MRLILTTCLLLVTGCFQVQNSFDNDDQIYAYRPPLDLSDPAQARLQAARNVFKKYYCVECHASRAGFNGFLAYSDEDWKDAYWGVVPGSIDDSRIFSRLKWSGCSTGDCNMPNIGSQMSDEDIQVIVDWIEQIDP